jgi:hypothetical protein
MDESCIVHRNNPKPLKSSFTVAVIVHVLQGSSERDMLYSHAGLPRTKNDELNQKLFRAPRTSPSKPDSAAGGIGETFLTLTGFLVFDHFG